LGTVAYTFFITAGVFGAMSVYGYFTKSDLSKMGTYLMMALFGLIIASLVNMFFANSTLEWIISIVGVLIFVGLTAWDTQMVKRLAASNLEPRMADKLATMGALNLYLDFINLFLYLLRIFGSSRD
jgi:FtsH-binding integral membrane protein